MSPTAAVEMQALFPFCGRLSTTRLIYIEFFTVRMSGNVPRFYRIAYPRLLAIEYRGFETPILWPSVDREAGCSSEEAGATRPLKLNIYVPHRNLRPVSQSEGPGPKEKTIAALRQPMKKSPLLLVTNDT